MHHFKAAIFDMDGLLLDSERLALEAFLYACNHLQLGDLSELFKRCIGTNSELGETILREGLKGITDFEQFGQIWDTEYKKLTETQPIRLMTGVKELLGHLEQLGIPMAVATSTKTERAKTKLKNSGIIDYFNFIVGGDQVEQSKPAPEIYLKAASEMALQPEDCLAFEDSANGVKSAVAAGMTVVQIPDLIRPDVELLKLGHIVLDSLDDVLEYDFKS